MRKGDSDSEMNRRETHHRHHRQKNSNREHDEHEEKNEGRTSQDESKVDRPHHHTTPKLKSKINKGRRNVEDLQRSSKSNLQTVVTPPTSTHGQSKPSEGDDTRHFKPSYIPSDTATSLEDKWERIEKWRQDGALSLARKEEAEAVGKIMYSQYHDARKSLVTSMSSSSPPSSDQSHLQEKWLHRVSLAVGKITPPSTTSPSTHEQSISTQLKRKERLLEFMNKSLSQNISIRPSQTSNVTLERSEMFNLTSAVSTDTRQTPFLKFTPSALASMMTMSKVSPTIIATTSKYKPQLKGKSKVRKDDISKKNSMLPTTTTETQAPFSTIQEPEKMEGRNDGSTLKVMNLPLSITLNDLKSLFPQSMAVTIPMNQFSDTPSQLSLETTPANPTVFVKFTTPADAQDVLTRFQGLKIRGHELKITAEHQRPLE